MNIPPAPTAGYIARFWSPLAATWIMMSLEGVLLAALIARLPDPRINLAAYGLAFSIAILVEAPVMMLMSAATALVRDRDSYRRLRLFTHGLSALATLPLCLLLIPSVFRALIGGLLNLPPDVADLTYGALWFFVPWTAAIGYRRFVQGVMIRAGATRRVAAGSLCRLGAMAGTALVLFVFLEMPGAWLGPASLVVGVLVEAGAARWMGAAAIRGALATTDSSAGVSARLTYRGIAAFYYPLVLMSVIGLTAHPMLTFLMGRAQAPLESLAVFPVIGSLSFIFRAIGFSYQEAAIALLGRDLEHRRAVGRFAAGLALACALGQAVFAVDPFFGYWFVTVSGLAPELAAYAAVPVLLLVPLPALSVWLSCQRAAVVLRHRTGLMTAATIVEVAGVAGIFAFAGWGLGIVGVTAACAALPGGRLLSNLYLEFRGEGLRGHRRVRAREHGGRSNRGSGG